MLGSSLMRGPLAAPKANLAYAAVKGHMESMTDTKKKRPRDPSQLAKMIVDIATGEADDALKNGKDPKAVARGKKGGSKGGKARAQKLSAKERSAAASRAARARWGH